MTADATTEQPPAASLGEQLHRIWRHKSVVLITTVVCAIIALLFTLFSVPKYSAEARLTINSLVSQANVGQKSAKPEKVDTNTEAQRAASKEVADRAADLLASEGADSGMDSKKLSKKLLASTKISAISQTSVLKIEVTDTDSKLAAQYANAISRAYLEFRETPLKQTINERVKQIDDQVAQLQGEDTKTNANKIADLQERRNQMTGLQTSGGEITKPAQTPTKVNGLTRPQTVLAGGAIGLLLGIFFAYAYDRSMRHIGYPDRLKDLGIMVQPLRPTSFDEDTLILMRRFGAPDGNLKKSKIPGVVIASESPALADQLHRQLYHILPDGVAHFTDYKALSKLLDNYTPEQIVESNDIPMVINLEDEAPLSTLLRLAEACQVCLVPVGETSSRSHMRKLFKHLQELDNTISIAVFMVSPKKNKVISNAPVKTA